MTTFRPALVAAFLSMVLIACGRDDEVATAGADNALLDYVPAETPYVAANLDRLPENVLDAYLGRMQPALDEMQIQLSAVRTDLEADSANMSPGTDPATDLALAVLRELDGKLSREGLASLGLDILAHKVVYGLGAFPVLRMGLSDAERLRATVRRVLDDAGIDATQQSFQGRTFWRLAMDEPQPAIAFYLAILDDHLAAALLPPAFESELLPNFVGLEMPAASDARRQLAELNHKHAYTPYGSGIVDLHRLADQFLQAGSVTARTLAEAGEHDPASVTPECVREIHEIIDNAPRMATGTVELSTEAIAWQYRLESPSELAGQLAGLVARLPAADLVSDRLLELSFGMRLGAARDFLREKTMAIVDDPYHCDYLQDINRSAEQSLAQLDQPMPPFLNNFRGLRVSLSEILMGQGDLPTDARGRLALHVDQPEMFVGMAQMFLPDLSGLALKPGNEPEQLPASLIPVPDVIAFAAMSGNAIGLSVGAGEEASLKDFLEQPAGQDDMFLSVNYDTAAYLDYTGQLDAWAQDDVDAHPARRLEAIGTAAREAMKKMADRSLTTMRFGPDGLVIDGRMTFRPDVSP